MTFLQIRTKFQKVPQICSTLQTNHTNSNSMVGRVDQWGPRLQLKPRNLSRIPRAYITAGATNPTHQTTHKAGQGEGGRKGMEKDHGKQRTGVMTQLVCSVLNLSSDSQHSRGKKLGVTAHTCNPSTGEQKPRESLGLAGSPVLPISEPQHFSERVCIKVQS